MKTRSVPGNRNATIILVFLIVLVPVLAVLQFRWIGMASEAEAGRMMQNLRATALQMSAEFQQEFLVLRDIVGRVADTKAARENPENGVDQALDFWKANARNPGILSALWLVRIDRSGGGGPLIERKLATEGAQWIRVGASEVPREVLDTTRTGLPPAPSLPPEAGLIPPPEPGQIPAAPPDAGPGATDFFIRTTTPRDPLFPIVFLAARPLTLLVLQYDIEAVRTQLLPRLVDSYFDGNGGLRGYRVLVRDGADGQVLFDNTAADPSKSEKRTPNPDGRPDVMVPLFQSRFISREVRIVSPQGLDSSEFDNVVSVPGVRMWLYGNRPGRDVVKSDSAAQDGRTWSLELRHIDGSVEEAANRVRWTNLGISSAILLVLTAGFIYLYRMYRDGRRVVRAQKDFVASVSHELRTPLSVLKSAAENLKEGIVRDPAQAVRYGERMANEADRLLSTTENILAYAGFEGSARGTSNGLASAASEFDLSALAAERIAAWKDAYAAMHARIEAELPLRPLWPADPTAPRVRPFMIRGDREALRAIFDNLLSNALRHGLPTEGDRVVRVRVKEQGRPQAPEHVAVIEVADSGRGIPRGEQRRLFEPFFRPSGAQSGGIGLGLSLVRRIAAMHGGTVSLESAVGKGCRFIVKIPAPDMTSPASDRKNDAGRGR